MKKKYKRIFKIIALLLSVIIALNFFFPEVLAGFLGKIKTSPPAEKLIEEASSNVEKVDKVLGEKVEKIGQKVSSGEGVINVEKIIETVVKDPIIVKQIEERVETVIQEKTERVQKIPEELKEKAKEEIKKEVKKQICEEWLE